MLIGYARVSTQDQNLDLQHAALKDAGCDRIYDDHRSAGRERPGLIAALDQARAGDVILVWRLDRLGRSLSDLITIIKELESREIGFRSLTEAIDTTTTGGRLVFHIFGALAEFERELIRERTAAGLASAREKGRVGGRPQKMAPHQIRRAKMLIDAGERAQDVAQDLSVSLATLYRALKR